METGEEMVVVREAKFNFRSKKVLQSLDMTVRSNSVYGLLGPSSCGKTTLLSCILGLKRLESGSVSVRVRSRARIGYMPQEMALFDNFTLEETCHFFGTFYGVPEGLIKKRTDYLLQFLCLEGCLSRPVGQCSGGEQRRISFMIALLHDPQLLILDEPTVGMDCLLSERIWEHLLKLSEAGKTIIITTHYIQEAKHCHTIGLMRQGQLLTEKPPGELMSSYQSTNLELIFLEVCRGQGRTGEGGGRTAPGSASPAPLSPHHQRRGKEVRKPKAENQPKLYPDGSRFDKHRFKALIYKNILWFKRNPLGTFELIFLPLLLSTLYGHCLRNPRGLEVGLYSAELGGELGELGGPGAGGLRGACGVGGAATLGPLSWSEELRCQLPVYLTCSYVRELEKLHVKVVDYPKRERLEEDLLANRVWGTVSIRRNFTASVLARVASPPVTSSHAFDASIIESRLDATNRIIKFMLMIYMKKAMENFYDGIMASCNISEKYHIIPIDTQAPLYGPTEIELGQGALPGFLCAFFFHFTLLYTSGAIMTEKVSGLFGRNIAGGMSYLEVVLAHLVIQFLVMMVQNFIMLANFYLVMGYLFAGSLALTLLLAFALNCVGISYGFLLTEMFTGPIAICFAGIGFTVTILVSGGLIWPQEGMHPILFSVRSLLPVVGVTNSMSSITIRDFGLFHPSVVTGFINTSVWTVLFGLSSLAVHKLGLIF